MRFLITGLIIISTSLISCKIIREEVLFADFVFINNTRYSISYGQGLEKYNLQPQSTIFVSIEKDGSGKNVKPENYAAPYFYESRFKLPIIIKINNRCWEPTELEEHSPLNINNYTAEKLGERKYKFTYTFTDADYERAVACP